MLNCLVAVTSYIQLRYKLKTVITAVVDVATRTGLDEIWRRAYHEAKAGNVPALRVLLEVERTRIDVDGTKRPTLLQIDGPSETQQQTGPSLREVLPAEVVADPRSVRAQALALHRALPAVTSEQAG